MAEATYYFNAYSDGVWISPSLIVDGLLQSFGHTNVNGQAQLLNSNSCPADDLGTITKVELRLYGKGDGDDKIVITPVFTGGDGDPHDTVPVVAPGDWTPYVDITNDTNHPDWSLWSHIQDLDCKIAFSGVGKKNTVYCAKVEIKVTYTIPWVPPESDIDVGADPIDRTDLYGMGYTLIDTNNPANASGILHTVKVYALGNIVGLRVGTFYATNGDVFKCRDSEFIGDVAAGAERTFTGLSIAVEEGDYIGCYYTAGAIECDKVGFLGLWGRYGEFIDPGDEAAQGFLEGAAISLYGYGDIEAPPPEHVPRHSGSVGVLMF
ncbi:hypothetical protein ES703_24418 [subsurface metagenome]